MARAVRDGPQGYPQPHQPALVPVAVQQHFAGQADQVLLAHEAVRRLKALPLAQQQSQRSEQAVQGGEEREGPEPQDTSPWFSGTVL